MTVKLEESAVTPPHQTSPAPLAVAPERPPAPVVSFEPRGHDWLGGLGAFSPMLATALTWALHVFTPLSSKRAAADTPWYSRALLAIFAVATIMAAVQLVWRRAKPWVRHHGPLLSAAVLTVCVWDMLTMKLALLPRIYFPGPEIVLQSMIADRARLLDSIWHSLLLLFCGYASGVIVGLVCGVLIGWSPRMRYWGMPLLKIIGPIPATAWIPISLVLLPSSLLAAIALVALAVWFPVTMLTASGISNVRMSYLDVARTLGAGRGYLIFRVAIPAAMPSIFLGLFMGLGTSFLTLVVAEAVGVQSGLGWYWQWAKESMDYSRVYAALLLMAAFFSLIMTGLFKLRDRVLVWQKGVIKW